MSEQISRDDLIRACQTEPNDMDQMFFAVMQKRMDEPTPEWDAFVGAIIAALKLRANAPKDNTLLLLCSTEALTDILNSIEDLIESYADQLGE